ncbi:MAG TPA: hypothetical protein VJI66_01920 [Candidatus Paceibacterota bacterium]
MTPIINIIEVIPISRAVGKESLLYFTSENIPLGAIVDVPLRKKTVQGVVISTRKADEMKSEIKSSGFALKKIEKVKSKQFFTKEFMEMISEAAKYYATTEGAIMDILVPEYILKNINKLKTVKIEKSAGADQTKTAYKLQNRYAVQGNDDERYGTWKSLIRQEFAKKKSLLFIMPTIEDTQYSFEYMEKGIGKYIFMLHGSLTEKEIVETWNKIMKEKHPVAVIATGGFLALPRIDIETIILERENNKSYQIPRRPFLDIRKIAEILALKKNMKMFVGDDLLRIETLHKESEGEIMQASPWKFRSLSEAHDALIDMKKYKSAESGFRILSEEAENLIVRTKEKSEHMIILATRRGLAPTTVCGDCQNIVLCNNCSAPVVLHKVGDKNIFLCHRCGGRRSTEEYCKICGSWKLGTVGIGIDLVIEKIKDKFPDIAILKIDSDSKVKSPREVVEKFISKPGSILVGTEMMLSYLHEKVENSAIISLDSLFALPDFRIQEKILYMLIRIRSLTSKNFIAQTRKSDEKVFEYGLKGNMSDFYRNEIESRKKFNYPPFTTLIKITLEGKKDRIVKEMEQAQNILDPYEVEVFPAFTHTIRGNYVLHGLLRLVAGKWQDNTLLEKLRTLPPSVKIKVDPETLL